MSNISQLIKHRWLPFWVAVFILGIVYTLSLQTTINGSDSAYTKDSGEIQVALNLAGTIHYSGYPLYTILSTSIAKAGVLIGLTPSAAASLSSLLWTLVSYIPLYAVLLTLSAERRWLAGASLLLLGGIETIWLHSVVAEVYSFTLIWLNWLLWIGIQLHQQFSDRKWLIGLLVLGTGIAHHRLLALIAPGFALIIIPLLWQRLRQQPILWLTSTAALLLPFLTYFYLPWRAWRGAQWVYGNPGTWGGFWAQFTGSEALEYVLGTPQNVTEFLQNIRFTYEALHAQLPLLIILVGTAGLILLIWQKRLLGVGYSIIATLTLVYMFILPGTVFPAAVLLPTIVCLIIGWILVLSLISDERVAVVITLTVAGWIAFNNINTVQAVVEADNGVAIISTLARLEQFQIEDTTVAIPWGGDYFAAAYGRHVSAELPSFTLVDHNADFRQVVEQQGSVLTLAYNLGIWSYDWWLERLGNVHFSTAAPGVAVVSQTPQFQTIPATQNFELGNGYRIRHAELIEQPDELHVIIYWEKEADNMSAESYSVAVHALSQNPPQSSADLIQQADAANPVGGWYPTALWLPGEIVRDDYLLPISAEATPNIIRIGMYRQNSAGEFINSEWLLLPLTTTSE